MLIPQFWSWESWHCQRKHSLHLLTIHSTTNLLITQHVPGSGNKVNKADKHLTFISGRFSVVSSLLIEECWREFVFVGGSMGMSGSYILLELADPGFWRMSFSVPCARVPSSLLIRGSGIPELEPSLFLGICVLLVLSCWK